MKLDQLVGKFAVRTAMIVEYGESLFMSSGPRKDASFTDRPIKIEAVQNGVVYYSSDLEPDDKLSIVGAKYTDDHWAEVPDELAARVLRKRL